MLKEIIPYNLLPLGASALSRDLRYPKQGVSRDVLWSGWLDFWETRMRRRLWYKINEEVYRERPHTKKLPIATLISSLFLQSKYLYVTT